MIASKFYNPRLGWCCAVAVVIAPCFWPIYRYTLSDINELVNSPRVIVDSQNSHDTGTVAHLNHADSTIAVRFKRYRWEKDARSALDHRVDLPIGENSIVSPEEIKFRRHNIIVTLYSWRGPDGRDFRKLDKLEMVELAKSIDAKIQNFEGTRLSIDTRGNKAFLDVIKPVFEDAEDLYEEIEWKWKTLRREFKRTRKPV